MAEEGSSNSSDRASSPSPFASPSLPVSSPPPLDRSVSTASTATSVSGRSSSSHGGRRRGYVRPQQTAFAESARHRDSVMSLGSIAHLQYYFARTGLLDGKGAQMRARQKGAAGGAEGGPLTSGEYTFSFASTAADKGPAYAISEMGLSTLSSADDSQSSQGLVESPIDDDMSSNWDALDGLMLPPPSMFPPTMSTYKSRPLYVPPPPDMAVLRRELREALEDATKLLRETERIAGGASPRGDGPEPQGWYEVQGMHLIDIVTLAIRAAKNFYTAHEKPQRLYSLKSERTLRRDLYLVLDILKKMANRNFAGGILKNERESIVSWVRDVGGLMDTDEEKERLEIEEREKWSWREGDWTGREREREWLFLKCFDREPPELPEWTAPSDREKAPAPFLSAMRNGLKLVLLHNELVRVSNRKFEEIKVYHTDTNKPYRCADNLRFWIKAAYLRWELKLDVDVMAVVHGSSAAAWRKFDDAVLAWCKGVREEITTEWKEQRKASQSQPPTLRIDLDHREDGPRPELAYRFSGELVVQKQRGDRSDSLMGK